MQIAYFCHRFNYLNRLSRPAVCNLTSSSWYLRFWKLVFKLQYSVLNPPKKFEQRHKLSLNLDHAATNCIEYNFAGERHWVLSLPCSAPKFLWWSIMRRVQCFSCEMWHLFKHNHACHCFLLAYICQIIRTIWFKINILDHYNCHVMPSFTIIGLSFLLWVLHLLWEGLSGTADASSKQFENLNYL